MQKYLKWPINHLLKYLDSPRITTRKELIGIGGPDLCPFNNTVPNCTKDKVESPLGVCSIFYEDSPVIVCPVRFRQEWVVAEHASEFFFPPDANWTSLSEVRLKDASGCSAGNIDLVLVSYCDDGKICDFGALEIQSVYISGNVRDPFTEYMRNLKESQGFEWSGPYYPRPDFLSSSRKRLAPQLLFKGGIIRSWNRKLAVALDSHFYATLPELREVDVKEADIAWLIYELKHDQLENLHKLTLQRIAYTRFSEALDRITKPLPGLEADFINYLQSKLDMKLANGGDSHRTG